LHDDLQLDVNCCIKEKEKQREKKGEKRKDKRGGEKNKKTTPFGANLVRSQVSYRAAQKFRGM